MAAFGFPYHGPLPPTLEQKAVWNYFDSIPDITNGFSFESLELEALRQSARRLGTKSVEAAVSHYEATHDPLTGTLNRAGLQEVLEHHLSRGDDIALLYVDGDKMKTVNSTFGRDGGDEVIKGTAGVLSKSLRKGDSLARIGGDEFLVVLDTRPRPNSKNSRQQIGVVQVRISTETQRYLEANPRLASVGFHISVGHAAWEKGMSIEQVRRNAEILMDETKLGHHQRIDLTNAPNQT